ncbi:MAG: hypothetical protein IJ017_04120 [Oscillospiraceae bacterium]|nr:hypothetical protein [Oscillospiraceae bacterium]
MKKAVSIILAVLMLVCVLTSCGAGKLVGTWTRQYTVLGVVSEDKFVFNEDGTGTMTTVLGIDVDMTYTAEDGKLVITVNTLGLETEVEYTYDFEKGNLLLTADGETLVFEKQK